ISFRPKPAFAPEAVLGHEEQSVLIAGVGECGMVRIVRAAHEVEAGVLDQLHIALGGRACDAGAPAAVVLMGIGAAKIKVLAVEEKAAIFRPLEPAKAELRFDRLDVRMLAKNATLQCVK